MLNTPNVLWLIISLIKISQQPENCENRNDPDLVQAFLKKWWVESDFKAPNLPFSLRLKVPAVTNIRTSEQHHCNIQYMQIR
jgi:hypothetical protein